MIFLTGRKYSMSSEELTARLAAAVKAEKPASPVRIMEVCGTHTMAIAKSGIKSMLPEGVELLSGPGCPVCVTPENVIDSFLDLAIQPDVITATYGDMVRVPGSIQGDNLARRRALGAKLAVVYSAADAVDLAERNPDKQIVFLGAGFETTAPGTAAAVLTAKDRGVRNFSLFSMLKTVEPALRNLMAMNDFNIQGFLCPGHVATIIGEKGFEFLPEEYNMPAVISGFEPYEILAAILLLLRQINSNAPKLENAYKRAVSRDGNLIAQRVISRCMEPKNADWRGLGSIPASGLKLKDEYSDFDAEKRYNIKIKPTAVKSACRCGDVITGRISPGQCPLFGARCVPDDPVGPCMVSSEGACAAAYKYQTVV